MDNDRYVNINHLSSKIFLLPEKSRQQRFFSSLDVVLDNKPSLKAAKSSKILFSPKKICAFLTINMLNDDL